DPHSMSDRKSTATRTGTMLTRRAPMKSAAYRIALYLCSPIVVPVLSQSGAHGVVSLRPSPGLSLLTITKSTAAAGAAATANNSKSARTRGLAARRLLIGLGHVSRRRVRERYPAIGIYSRVNRRPLRRRQLDHLHRAALR